MQTKNRPWGMRQRDKAPPQPLRGRPGIAEPATVTDAVIRNPEARQQDREAFWSERRRLTVATTKIGSVALCRIPHVINRLRVSFSGNGSSLLAVAVGFGQAPSPATTGAAAEIDALLGSAFALIQPADFTARRFSGGSRLFELPAHHFTDLWLTAIVLDDAAPAAEVATNVTVQGWFDGGR